MGLHRRVLILTATALFVAVGACPTALASEGVAAESTSAEMLWGRTYTLAAIKSRGEKNPFSQPLQVEIDLIFYKFSGGKIFPNEMPLRYRGVGIVGCNTRGAKMRLAGGVVKVEKEFVSTKRHCAERLQLQEEWIQDFLVAEPLWRLDDTRLTLTSPGATLKLRETSCDPTQAADCSPFPLPPS